MPIWGDRSIRGLSAGFSPNWCWEGHNPARSANEIPLNLA